MIGEFIAVYLASPLNAFDRSVQGNPLALLKESKTDQSGSRFILLSCRLVRFLGRGWRGLFPTYCTQNLNYTCNRSILVFLDESGRRSNKNRVCGGQEDLFLYRIVTFSSLNKASESAQ